MEEKAKNTQKYIKIYIQKNGFQVLRERQKSMVLCPVHKLWSIGVGIYYV